MTTAAFTVAADHPCLPGHFPGNPIVPGVVLLDHALAIMDAAGLGALTLVSAKFTAPVRPDAPVTVTWERLGGGRVGFACHCDAVPVLRGVAA